MRLARCFKVDISHDGTEPTAALYDFMWIFKRVMITMITDAFDTYVFIDVVKATITRNEASNLLSVLDQLHTDTLTNGRVRLFGLKTTT